MHTTKPSSEQTVIDVLNNKAGATAAEIAAAGKLGRSTVSKALVRLESAGTVTRSQGGHDGTRRLHDRWSLVRTRTRKPRRAAHQRLRPGELDGLVLSHLREHSSDGPLGPTAIAQGLGRSSGAVSNCLKRLASTRQIRQVGKHPLRYTTRT